MMTEKVEYTVLEMPRIAVQTEDITENFVKESSLSLSNGNIEETEKINSVIETEKLETNDCDDPMTSLSKIENHQASTLEKKDQNHIASTVQDYQKALTSTALQCQKYSTNSGETYPNGCTFDDYWKVLIAELEEKQNYSTCGIECVKGEDTKPMNISNFKAESYDETNIEFLKVTRIDSSCPCVTERFYKPLMFGEDGSAQCVLVHSNRLQIVTISPYHPIVANKKTVISVKYEKNGNVNLLNNKVSGKFKRGGLKMKENSVLCSVKCSDDSEYTFVSCIRGTLIEVNERLIDQPNLLHEKPWSDGYIAIILPIFPRPQRK